MGFGSYDESERQEQNVDGEGINVHEHQHEGGVSTEGADSDELLDRLQDIKRVSARPTRAEPPTERSPRPILLCEMLPHGSADTAADPNVATI